MHSYLYLYVYFYPSVCRLTATATATAWRRYPSWLMPSPARKCASWVIQDTRQGRNEVGLRASYRTYVRRHSLRRANTVLLTGDRATGKACSRLSSVLVCPSERWSGFSSSCFVLPEAQSKAKGPSPRIPSSIVMAAW